MDLLLFESEPPKTLGSLTAKQLDETCLTAWQ